MSFPHYNQPDAMDCGPIRQLANRLCLHMVTRQYGKPCNKWLVL
ncbi:hypothetical protein SAMN05216323_10848 [Williamwhitmania taraxaci]|uniref:Uncharacterized protein n=1 Tax=Williamwhitmania taraxaci TaxID=1640674 RepID=A0A1G6S1A3_9BACT|nr:hypothetical protein SAMN05216323_10848 [Williamwhitmania taraxaci]